MFSSLRQVPLDHQESDLSVPAWSAPGDGSASAFSNLLSPGQRAAIEQLRTALASSGGSQVCAALRCLDSCTYGRATNVWTLLFHR